MELAKPAFDVGLYYDGDLEPVLEFWRDRAGIGYDEMLPVGGGVRQHRHRFGDSIIKVNHARTPLAESPPSGYRNLHVAADTAAPQILTDPRDNTVVQVPAGHDGITQLRLQVATDNTARLSDFYGDVLQLTPVREGLFACGVTQLEIVAGEPIRDHEMRSHGYRYITLQVFDVVAEHAGILARGGAEGRAPVRLGEVAYISFVRDPDGNWIEISQRKSLTGSLA